MKHKTKFINIVAGVFMANLSGWAWADVSVQSADIPSASAPYTRHSKDYLLALNESSVVIQPAKTTDGMAATDTHAGAAAFEPPLFSGSNAHKYMGLATVALVGLTAITAPDDEGGANKSRTQGTHQSLGRTTAAMAAATVTSGLLTHWDDFHLEDGLTDPDNMHVMLGTLGALAMLKAVSVAPGGGHAGSGIAGGVAMAAAIKLTW